MTTDDSEARIYTLSFFLFLVSVVLSFSIVFYMSSNIENLAIINIFFLSALGVLLAFKIFHPLYVACRERNEAKQEAEREEMRKEIKKEVLAELTVPVS